jgi:hypothetical protein
MAGYGWSYLTVTHAPNGVAAAWRTSDGGSFASEAEMFRELGVTGWELVSIRESGANVIYYFKRSRA